MKSLILLPLLLLSFSSFATSRAKIKAPELSLREKALTESKIEGLATSTATDAQVSGMLTLKDPRPEVITRSWNYFAALTGQSIQAQGVVQKAETGTFDLNKNEQTFMPGVELGVISHPLQTKELLWKVGLRAKAGLASQSTAVMLDSGFVINDARLNTTIFSGGPQLSLQWSRLNWLALTLSPQFGSLNYTQTSANEFATFSKQAGFEALSYGLEFSVNKRWSLFTEQTQRSLKDNAEIALQKDSFELGTKVTW